MYRQIPWFCHVFLFPFTIQCINLEVVLYYSRNPYEFLVSDLTQSLTNCCVSSGIIHHLSISIRYQSKFFLCTDYDLDAFRDIKPFQLPKSKDCDRYNDLPTSGFLNWAACSQPPRYIDMPPPLQRIHTNTTEEVVFFNVQKCYEKVQCRKNKKSKQRVQGATINMRVTTDIPSKVEVYVERLPKAAVLCGDSNGRVPLKPKMENVMYSDVSISYVMRQNACVLA